MKHLAPRTAYTAARDRKEIWHLCLAKHCARHARHARPARSRADILNDQLDEVLAADTWRTPVSA